MNFSNHIKKQRKGLTRGSEKNSLVESLILSGETELALTLLRQSGLSQIESIKFVRRVLDLSLVEVKEIVHFNLAYADYLGRNELLHNDVETGFLKDSND